MDRIQTVCAGVLMLAAYGTSGAQAQGDERGGPGPVNSTQSISAGVADTDVAEKEDVGHDTENGATAGHQSGTYAGVVPGAATPAHPPKAPSPKAPLTITWPGFQMRPDGSSRVFIQSNKPLTPKVLKAPDGKFELELPGAHVAAKTNRLPLDTRFFNTPVAKVSVNAAHSGAILKLDMRASVTPQITSEQGPAGYYFTYIELPKGDYIKHTSGSAAGAATSAGTDPSANLPTLQMARPASKVIGRPTSAQLGGTGHARDSGEGSWSASGSGTSAAPTEIQADSN